MVCCPRVIFSLSFFAYPTLDGVLSNDLCLFAVGVVVEAVFAFGAVFATCSVCCWPVACEAGSWRSHLRLFGCLDDWNAFCH